MCEPLASRWFITQPPPTPYPALQGSVLLLWVIWLYEPTVPPLGEDHGSDQVLVVNGLPVHGFSLAAVSDCLTNFSFLS